MKKLLTIGVSVILIGLFISFAMTLIETDVQSPKQISKKETTGINLRFGHNIPEDSAMHQASLRFANLVAKKTDGLVEVKIFPAQKLGNDHQMVDMARAGELDILLTPTAKMSVPVPEVQYADLPFLFPSREDAYEMLDGEPGQILLHKLRAIDLVGVTFWENGFKHFTANRPIIGPDDFQGLKIRTMKSRIIMEQFKAFGAIPIPIDFHATRTALKDGVVDGQENPLIAIVSMKFHEVQPHFTFSNHAYLPYIFSISKKVYDKLPQNIQKVLVETAREVTPWERQETQRREKMLLETIQNAGVKIHYLDDEKRRQFANKTAHIIDQFEPIIGADVISKTSELLMKKYVDKTANPILIGIDTDLSMDAKVSGLSIKRGAQLAIGKINAEGGILGRPMALITRDHKGIPSKGLDNLKDFINDEHVVAVIGGQHGSVVSAEIKVAQKSGIPFLVPWAAVAKITENDFRNSYIFRVSANDRLAAPFILKHALFKGRRPAVLYENSVWGRGNWERMKASLKQDDMAFSYQEAINRGVTDLSVVLDRVMKSGADVLIMIVKPMEGGKLVKSMAEKEVRIPIVSHWGITGGYFFNDNKAALAKVDLSFFQTFSLHDHSNIAAKELAERYVQRYGLTSIGEIVAPVAVVHSYDAVGLLAMAIKQAASTDRSAVRDALERLPSYPGILKTYSPAFTPEQHDALSEADYHMARFDHDGTIVPVKNRLKDE